MANRIKGITVEIGGDTTAPTEPTGETIVISVLRLIVTEHTVCPDFSKFQSN